MTKFYFDWQSADNQKLIGACWLPESPIKALICLVHGFGEHIGRYDPFASFWAENQFGVMAFDLRGHGRSEGKRGDTPSMQAFLEDIRQFLALASTKFPNVPLFLYGHSMGGNLVANYVLDKKPDYLKGVIITSPWLRLAFSPPAIKIFLGQIVEKIYPQYTERSDMDTAGLSRDSVVVKTYRNDPLIHKSITVRLFGAITMNGEKAIREANHFSLPLLLMHGKADPVTSVTASQEFGKKIKQELITEKYWDECLHELHNELNRDEILALILEWLKQKL